MQDCNRKTLIMILYFVLSLVSFFLVLDDIIISILTRKSWDLSTFIKITAFIASMTALFSHFIK